MERYRAHTHVEAVITILLQLAADNLLLVPCHFQTSSIMSEAPNVLTYLGYVTITLPFHMAAIRSFLPSLHLRPGPAVNGFLTSAQYATGHQRTCFQR